MFNVIDYGADPTGATSSDAAFTAWAAAIVASDLGPHYGAWQARRGGTGIIPPGIYTGLTSYDFTNTVGVTIEGAGWCSALYADGQSQSLPVLDFAGSSYAVLRDFSVMASKPDGSPPAIMPQAALLLADTASAPGSSNVNSCERVRSFGFWTKPSLAIYRSTNNRFAFCQWRQDAQVGPAVYIGSRNFWGYSSGFAPLAPAGFIAAENVFNECEIHGAKRADAVYAPLHIDGADTVQLRGGIIDSNGVGQPYVYFTGPCGAPLFDGTKFYSENGTPCGEGFYADLAAVVDRLTFRNGRVYTMPTGPMIAGAGKFTNTRALEI